MWQSPLPGLASTIPEQASALPHHRRMLPCCTLQSSLWLPSLSYSCRGLCIAVGTSQRPLLPEEWNEMRERPKRVYLTLPHHNWQWRASSFAPDLEHLELQEMGTDADSTANKYDYIATFLVYKTAWRNLKPKPLELTRDLSWPNGQDKATSVSKQRNQRDNPAPKKAQETDFKYF